MCLQFLLSFPSFYGGDLNSRNNADCKSMFNPGYTFVGCLTRSTVRHATLPTPAMSPTPTQPSPFRPLPGTKSDRLPAASDHGPTTVRPRLAAGTRISSGHGHPRLGDAASACALRQAGNRTRLRAGRLEPHVRPQRQWCEALLGKSPPPRLFPRPYRSPHIAHRAARLHSSSSSVLLC